MAGRNGYQFFFEDMLVQAKQAILLQSELRTALAQSQFVLHYQPQADLRTGEIVGAEALLRWQRPGVGLVGPSEFLLVAEDSGLILGINEWVLREACRQAVAWLRDGTPVRVAVNLSALQFQKQDLCSLVMGVLETTGLPASLLELELTEGILLEHAEAAAAALEQLHAHGVRFSIDDFGTGHSSLSHLKSVHVDRLKIDRSFIHNLEVDPSDIAIVRAIIGLGRALNLEVLAEGVETVEQLTVLRAEGCDSVQGYYFSRPLAAADLQMVVREERLRAAPASMHV
jgi:EAL domain-containing protein (putative c-di-GMP-specific phosphodiesterase class I)